ncbi:MAG TPA: prephenate dehydrogenase/arogenate dehydrogenase family protein [Casimicrobiaceae bacterium]|nr:prephenate dehydrogenase/arogenate dehydrogenase family protein [Casimicrobiaceae bacterium]
MNAAIRKLVVIGVGLIGGSFALAMRRSGTTSTVLGVGRGRANLDTALRLGLVERALMLDDAWTSELRDADLVLLATPVGQMPSLFQAMASHVGPRTVITDTGSTKQDVIDAARRHLAGVFPRFVPGHPIAGTEHSGAAAAFEALFRDRQVVLTPQPETDAGALDLVSGCWERCGASVRELDARRHDAILSAVSHLPHVLAFALVAELASRPDAGEHFELAGTGLRDATRLASSHAGMWRDIALANRDALRRDIARYRDELARIDGLLERRDGDALSSLFSKAREARDAWIASTSGSDDA